MEIITGLMKISKFRKFFLLLVKQTGIRSITIIGLLFAITLWSLFEVYFSNGRKLTKWNILTAIGLAILIGIRLGLHSYNKDKDFSIKFAKITDSEIKLKEDTGTKIERSEKESSIENNV